MLPADSKGFLIFTRISRAIGRVVARERYEGEIDETRQVTCYRNPYVSQRSREREREEKSKEEVAFRNVKNRRHGWVIAFLIDELGGAI